MLDYGLFGLVVPPRCGGAWFAAAAAALGFTAAKGGNIRLPPPDGYTGQVVTLVRHPVPWTCSLIMSNDPTAHLESAVMRHTATYGNALMAYVKQTQATTVIRLEAIRPSACEFFGMMGVDRLDLKKILHIPPTNPQPYRPVTAAMWAAILAAESELCEAYDYW